MMAQFLDILTNSNYFKFEYIKLTHKMRILIAGGDGFIGWPFSLRMSNLGWEVLIVDNLSRRQIDEKEGYSSVTPIKSIEERIKCWKQVSGNEIQFLKIDIAHQKSQFFQAFAKFKPDVVAHLAEQRAAPYSMKSLETIDYTYENNTLSTKNILMAVMKHNQKCHIVHIGTMGVYGYGALEGLDIPQGYCMAKLNCTHTEKCQCQPVEIIHPYYPGSIYHMTKCLDNVTLLNFQKFFGLKITELHQGIVWGVNTPETDMHPDLINRVDIDSDYGTVLNRFCSQVANGYPMTLYGTGGQTRAFININDSMKCLCMAIEYGQKNQLNKVHILNQMTATHELNELKDILVRLYPEAKFEYIKNPRNEKAENTLKVKNDNFKNLGFVGIEINEQDLKNLVEVCKKYPERFKQNSAYIQPISFWGNIKK